MLSPKTLCFNQRVKQGFSMSSSPSFGQNINVEKNQIITVTKRTVRFSKNVYQTKNVASFSEGNVTVSGLPWLLLIALIILGFAAVSFNWIGWLLMLTGGAGVFWNLSKPKNYGLLLSLNSGEKSLFVSSDTEGLKKVISVIYDLVENETEATYQINISNAKIEGNFIAGSNTGSMAYK
jgi:Family of unknown function (DUF6232)